MWNSPARARHLGGGGMMIVCCPVRSENVMVTAAWVTPSLLVYLSWLAECSLTHLITAAKPPGSGPFPILERTFGYIYF